MWKESVDKVVLQILIAKLVKFVLVASAGTYIRYFIF